MTTHNLSALIQKLQQYQNRRKLIGWKPEPASTTYQGSTTTIEYQVLLRCLHFIDLEIEVANWIQATKLEPAKKEALQTFIDRNSADERNHFKALTFLSNYYGNPIPSTEATEIAREWGKQLPTYALAYALEMGLFMSLLPYMNRHGDIYTSTVSQWISDDEQVHVTTNRDLAKYFGQKLTKAHLRLVERTVRYVFEPLGQEEVDSRAMRAIKRLTTGKDPAMILESAPITPLFFEQQNTGNIIY